MFNSTEVPILFTRDLNNPINSSNEIVGVVKSSLKYSKYLYLHQSVKAISVIHIISSYKFKKKGRYETTEKFINQ